MKMTWDKLNNELVASAQVHRMPIMGQFELTSRCNLRCKMCYVCNPANDIEVLEREHSAREWIHLAEEARDAGMLHLLLTGGEVFLRKDFKRIYEEISMMGFNTKIYTNATMITPQIASWLGRIPPSEVEVTLYGASAETYAKVCGCGDAFSKTVRGIDLLQAEGIALQLKTTVVRDNANEFNKIAAFAEKRAVEFGVVTYVSPRREGNTLHPESHRLSPRELAEYENNVDRYFKEKERKASNVPQSNEYWVDEEHFEKTDECKESQNICDPFECLVGKCSFWVTWDGKMTACGLTDEPATFPFQKGFGLAWEELKTLCANIPVCTACMECPVREYCITCPMRLKIETGFYDKPAPYFCELVKWQESLREI